MRNIVFLVLGLMLCACDDPKAARRALDAAGFTDVETLGWSAFGCGQGDTYATLFRAKNPKGYTVTGVVCSGWTKGSTIRFD